MGSPENMQLIILVVQYLDVLQMSQAPSLLNFFMQNKDADKPVL